MLVFDVWCYAVMSCLCCTCVRARAYGSVEKSMRVFCVWLCYRTLRLSEIPLCDCPLISLFPQYWATTVRVLLETVVRVKEEVSLPSLPCVSVFHAVAVWVLQLGIEFEFVNIGGGLGIPYQPHEVRVSLFARVSVC